MSILEQQKKLLDYLEEQKEVLKIKSLFRRAKLPNSVSAYYSSKHEIPLCHIDAICKELNKMGVQII